MAKLRSIRITSNDEQEYRKLANNVRQKIRRVNKNYGVDLSNDIGIPPLSSFRSRETYNRWKREAQSFTNRNNLNYQYVKNDFGVVATKSELNQIALANAESIRNAKRLIKNVKKRPSKKAIGGKVGYEIAPLKDSTATGVAVPLKFDFGKIKSRYRLKQVKEQNIKRRDIGFYKDRMAQMKRNYIKALRENFNSMADDVVSIIESLDDEHFYDAYLQNIRDLYFGYVYTEDEDGQINQIQDIEDILREYRRTQGKSNLYLFQ